MRMWITTLFGILVSGGVAHADQLVATRPGVMCLSPQALARLTLPDGSSRSAMANARRSYSEIKRAGGCRDIQIGERVSIITIRRNTSIVVTDGKQTVVVPNIDFERVPGNAVASVTPAPVTPAPVAESAPSVAAGAQQNAPLSLFAQTPPAATPQSAPVAVNSPPPAATSTSTAVPRLIMSVTGVSLGMSLDEARKIIGPGFQQMTKPGNSLVQTVDEFKPNEAYGFALFQGKIFSIAHAFNYGTSANSPTDDAVKAALLAKYGPTSFPTNGADFTWDLDKKGHLVIANLNPAPNCGVTVSPDSDPLQTSGAGSIRFFLRFSNVWGVATAYNASYPTIPQCYEHIDAHYFNSLLTVLLYDASAPVDYLYAQTIQAQQKLQSGRANLKPNL